MDLDLTETIISWLAEDFEMIKGVEFSISDYIYVPRDSNEYRGYVFLYITSNQVELNKNGMDLGTGILNNMDYFNLEKLPILLKQYCVSNDRFNP